MSKNKSFSTEISERYALALYDLSKDQNQINEFELSMNNFMKIYESNEDLKSFVKNPTYSTSSQQKVFEKITNLMNFNKIIKNFFSILVIKKRIFFLDKIIQKFLKLISLKRGEIKANLISSKKIDSKILSDLEKQISESVKHPIKLNYKIDESLLGGIIIQIGSLMIDTSVKNKLKKYKKLMIEA